MTQALQKPKEDRSVEYIPFGTDSKIKLSIAIVQQQIAKRTKAGHTCSESDAVRFVMLCQARALNPFEGDAFLIGFDSKDGPQFNIVTGEQAFLKRAEASSEYDGMESGIIVRDENGNIADREGTFYLKGEQVLGGWCSVHFKTKKFPQKERIRIEPYANRVGAGPLWETNPERMCQKVAESAALRKAFPTKLGGLYSEAEVQTHEDRFRAAKPTVAVAMPSEQNFLTAEPSEPPRTVEPEVGYAPAAPPPTHEPPAPAPPPTPTPYHIQLVDWLKERNIEEERFWRWLEQSGLLPNADALSSIGEIPVDVVARLMKARDGMLKGIKELT